MPNQDTPTEEENRDTLTVLTEQAKDVAQWDSERIHSFERKAGVLLGASGTVLTLLLGLMTLADGADAALPASWALMAAVVLLLISVLAAAFCLMTKTTSYVSVRQLKSAWKRAAAQIKGETADDPLRPTAAQGITIRALLEGQPDDDKKKAAPAALDALRTAAKTKAWALKITVGTFAAGVGITGGVAIKTIKGVMGSG